MPRFIVGFALANKNFNLLKILHHIVYICVYYCNQNCKIEKIKSGTIIAYEYAKRKNKVIINVCEKLH